MKFLVVILLISFNFPARATISLPSSLSVGEQQLILQILGFGSSFRPVNNPYPMSGLEFGISAQSLTTGDIGYYGSHSTVSSYTLYPLINFGKGLFDNLDLLFSFLPFNESTSMGIYAGGLRWAFYQPTFVPANFSILLSAANSNFNNLFIAQTLGADLITSVNIDPFAFYFGAGTLYGQAQFSKNLTADGLASNLSAQAFHTIIGTSVTLSDFFLAGEVDTYNVTVISFKLGTRL